MADDRLLPLQGNAYKPEMSNPAEQKRTEELEFLEYLEKSLLKKIKKENLRGEPKRKFTKSRLLTYRNMRFMEEETTVTNLLKYHKQLRKRAAYYKKEFRELGNELAQIDRIFKKRLGLEEYVPRPVKELYKQRNLKHRSGAELGLSPYQPRLQCGRYSTQVTDVIVGPDSLESLIRSRNATFSNIGLRCPVSDGDILLKNQKPTETTKAIGIVTVTFKNKHMGERTYNVCINDKIYFLRRPEYVEGFVKDAQLNVTTGLSNGYTALYNCEKIFTGITIGIFGANEHFVQRLSKDLDIPAYSLTDIFIKPIVYEHLQTSPRYLFSFFRSGIGMNAPIFIDQLRLFLQLVILPYENHVIFHGMRMTHELQQSMKMYGLKFHVLINIEPEQPPQRTLSHNYSITHRLRQLSLSSQARRKSNISSQENLLPFGEISLTHVNASSRGLNEDIFFSQLGRFIQLVVFTMYRLLTKTQFAEPFRRPGP